MRELYSFTLNKKETVEEVEISKDAEGNEVKTTKKVDKEVPHKFVVKKPTRAQGDDCELFRAATESDYIKRGIITAPLLEKRISEDGDIYTQQQKDNFEQLRKSFDEKKKEFDELSKGKAEEKTEEQNKVLGEKIKELAVIVDEIQKLKNLGANLYNRTAEALAFNKSCLWLVLMLSYEDKNGKLAPVFGDGNFEAKLKAYDTMEENEDEFEYSLIEKLVLIVHFWKTGRADAKEDFDALFLIKDQSKEEAK